MQAATPAELNDLAFHCDQAYEIGFDETTGTWSARSKASQDQLTGRTSEELRLAIRADCQQRRLAEQRSLAGLKERSST
jgi:hypothetical protein